MKTLRAILISILTCSTGAIALAQSATEGAQREEERAGVEAQRAESRAQLEAARAQLEAARAEVERAARELARLSAEQYRLSAEQLAGFRNREFANRNFTMFRRPLLGLNIDNDEDGVRVVGVSPGGPGDESGIEIGDLIVAIDGVAVDASAAPNTTRAFLEVLNDIEPGGEVELELLRDGEPMTLTVETNESNMPAWIGDISEPVITVMRDIPRYAERNLYRVMEQPFFLGPWSEMELVELTPELGAYFGTDEGLLVVRGPEDDDIDLRDGDVILEIGGRVPQSVGHAMRIIRSFEPDETLELTIMREQRRQRVELSR